MPDETKQATTKPTLAEQNRLDEADHKAKMAEIERTAMRLPDGFDGGAAEWMIVGAAMASPQFFEYIQGIGVVPDCTTPNSEKQFRLSMARDILQSVARSYRTKQPLDGDGLHALQQAFGYRPESSLSAVKQVARMKGIQALIDQTKAIGADLQLRGQMRSDAPKELAERCRVVADWLAKQAENLKEE